MCKSRTNLLYGTEVTAAQGEEQGEPEAEMEEMGEVEHGAMEE